MRDFADEFDGKAALGRREDDAVHETAQDLQRLALRARVAQCLLQVLHFPPIDLGESGMEPRR